VDRPRAERGTDLVVAERVAWVLNRLDPGVRKAALAALGEQDHHTRARDLAASVVCEDSPRLQITAGELAEGGERLGSLGIPTTCQGEQR